MGFITTMWDDTFLDHFFPTTKQSQIEGFAIDWRLNPIKLGDSSESVRNHMDSLGDFVPPRINHQLPSSKLTWQWNTTILNRRYIFKWLFFHCHLSFLGVVSWLIYQWDSTPCEIWWKMITWCVSSTSFRTSYYLPWNQRSTWTWMIGILVSYWDGLFSGAMLVSGGVDKIIIKMNDETLLKPCFHLDHLGGSS